MSIRTIFVTGAVSAALVGPAVAAPVAAPHGTLVGHGADVRRLLAETHDARAAAIRGERRAARDLVSDALALSASLGTTHRFGAMAHATGEVTELQLEHGQPVATRAEQFASREVLDLPLARHDLLAARFALDAGWPRIASRFLGDVDGAVVAQERTMPARGGLAAANLRLGLDEMIAGDWAGARVALRAALAEVTPPAAKP